MSDASNVLEFPNKRHQKDLSPSEYDNDYFDSWEIHYELHRDEDYTALVKHCESVIEVNPDEDHYFKFSALDLYEELVKDTRFMILEEPSSKRWSLVTKAK